MTSPSLSANTSPINFDRHDKAYNHQQRPYNSGSINSAQQFIDSLCPSPIYSPHTRQLSSRMSSSRTPDSMSQVLNINLKKFDFEMDTANKSSIDFILDQIHENYQDDSSNSIQLSQSTSNRKTSKKSGRQQQAKHAKTAWDDKTNLVSLNQTSFIENVSRQSSIRSLISNVDSNNHRRSKKTSSTSAKAVSAANLFSMSSSTSSSVSMAKIVNGLNIKTTSSSTTPNPTFQNFKNLKEKGKLINFMKLLCFFL